MFLIYGKRVFFLAVLSLLLTAQTISAQTTARRKISFGKTEIIAETRGLRLPPVRLETQTAASFDYSKIGCSQPAFRSCFAQTAQAERLRSGLLAVQAENLYAQTGEISTINFQQKIKNIKYQVRKAEAKKRNLNFDANEKRFETVLKDFDANDDLPESDSEREPRYVRETAVGRGFNYRGAFTQSLMFLAVQHGYAMTQPKTREALKHGAFWRDYADSVKNLRGWDDGGRFFTNYIAHPMQGAFTGHIYVQNSPQALREQFSMSPKYWKTRMKALLWTTAWSTQFEIGPISQASIGNVGLNGKQTWEDIIVTPTAGTAMLIAEDAIDRYIMKAIERRTDNFYVKIFARMLLNPTRNFSNLLRFRAPWYRDRAVAR